MTDENPDTIDDLLEAINTIPTFGVSRIDATWVNIESSDAPTDGIKPRLKIDYSKSDAPMIGGQEGQRTGDEPELSGARKRFCTVCGSEMIPIVLKGGEIGGLRIKEGATGWHHICSGLPQIEAPFNFISPHYSIYATETSTSISSTED